MHFRMLAILSFVLASCATQAPSDGKIPIDQVPMYGGMDRDAVPELKAADEKLIEGTTKEFKSRETAGAAFIERGFRLYQQDDLSGAMRRFNQAWLLSPENPEVYAGFASVLHDQGKVCEAREMMDKALALNPPAFKGIYPDAGRVFALCAVSNKALSPETKVEMLIRSENLFRKAEEVEPNKSYVYGTWATAYYWREKYAEAWSMVAKERAAGGEPSETFLRLLQAKMAEPVR